MEIYCIYITKKKKLVYKMIHCDNYLKVNSFNSYGHKLIVKKHNRNIKRILTVLNK